jgi:hypothetical protein
LQEQGGLLKKTNVVIRKAPVERVRWFSHHEDHEDHEARAEKFSYPLFVNFVAFVVIRALLG